MPSSPLSPRFLEQPNVDYLKSQIETGHPDRTKKALQDLCKLYRAGFRVRPPQLAGIENSIVGLLYTQEKNEKVRRWALNAIARLGREDACLQTVLHIITTHSQEPQTIAAGVAAVFQMCRNPVKALQGLSFDRQIMTLAALQHADASKIDTSTLPIDVETASPDLLRLALVLVGLERAPPNLLNPRHDNAEMVKALGCHHDSIVCQYSVWAITENPTLGVADLGVALQDVEQLPANVRAWIFQLIGMTPHDAVQHMEYIELGARDPESEARAGLAAGLKDTFFDGIEPLVLNWFTTEHDQEVSHNLLDHIVRQARHSLPYNEMALGVYEKEAPGSILRRRMEASAVGSALYTSFKRIEYNGSGDLFGGGINVTNNNTFNLYGGIQGGAVSLGGKAENSGATSIHYNPQTLELIRSELSKAERELYSADIDARLKTEALEHVQAAKVDPSPDRLQKAIDVLGKVEVLAGKAMSAGAALASSAKALAAAAGLA